MFKALIEFQGCVVCKIPKTIFLTEVQHVRNCPIDCASLYYNGVHRSGIYIVVPSLRAVPVEVFCDMETEGKDFFCLLYLRLLQTQYILNINQCKQSNTVDKMKKTFE